MDAPFTQIAQMQDLAETVQFLTAVQTHAPLGLEAETRYDNGLASSQMVRIDLTKPAQFSAHSHAVPCSHDG